MKRKAPDKKAANANTTRVSSLTAEGSGDSGLQGAGLAAAGRPTKPSQEDIDAGVAMPVKEYMQHLVPYVQVELAAFLRGKDARFKGASR